MDENHKYLYDEESYEFDDHDTIILSACNDYKKADNIWFLVKNLQNYCEENALPIFNGNNVYKIISEIL